MSSTSTSLSRSAEPIISITRDYAASDKHKKTWVESWVRGEPQRAIQEWWLIRVEIEGVGVSEAYALGGQGEAASVGRGMVLEMQQAAARFGSEDGQAEHRQREKTDA